RSLTGRLESLIHTKIPVARPMTMPTRTETTMASRAPDAPLMSSTPTCGLLAEGAQVAAYQARIAADESGDHRGWRLERAQRVDLQPPFGHFALLAPPGLPLAGTQAGQEGVLVQAVFGVPAAGRQEGTAEADRPGGLVVGRRVDRVPVEGGLLP